jgi:hypothetical protein
VSSLQLFVTAMALLNVIVVVEFVRRRLLKESFALLWIAVGAGGVILGLARPLVDRAAEAVGVAYGPALVFALAIAFLLFVCMTLSLQVSRLEARTEVLAEEVAFLRGATRPEEAA